MKTTANNIRLQFNADMRPEIVITLQTAQDIVDLQATVKAGKLLSVEIKPYRAHRSLDANAYLWVMLEKLATALHTSKDELYLLMLERYGVFTHLIVKPQAVDRIIAEWRTVRNLGEVTINGQKGVQLQCYFGSSAYDSQEMARLIDGVVSEAAELGIDVLTESEKSLLIEKWGR